MSAPQEKTWSIVVCEGFHDRAFWKGMLLNALGCTDPSEKEKRDVYDLKGDKITKGRFGFHDNQKRLVVLVPAHGEKNVQNTTLEFLRGRDEKPLRRLVLNVDDDAAVGSPSNEHSHRQSFTCGRTPRSVKS
jgi:hypothetical protein